MYYVYVLQSLKKQDWFYKGSTNNLKRRVTQHNIGECKSSAPYRPFRLVYYEAYVSESVVRKRESTLKKGGSTWVPLRRRIIESLKNCY